MNKVDFSQVKNEIQLIEKNDVALLKADTARLGADIGKTKIRIAEELRRLQSDVRLELSLEKGRTRDEQASQQIKIKEAESKIDAEVSNLRTQMETIKWEVRYFTLRCFLINLFRCSRPLYPCSAPLVPCSSVRILQC